MIFYVILLPYTWDMFYLVYHDDIFVSSNKYGDHLCTFIKSYKLIYFNSAWGKKRRKERRKKEGSNEGEEKKRKEGRRKKEGRK